MFLGKRQGDRTDSFNQLPERKRKLLEEAIAVLTPAAKDDTALPVFNVDISINIFKHNEFLFKVFCLIYFVLYVYNFLILFRH